MSKKEEEVFSIRAAKRIVIFLLTAAVVFSVFSGTRKLIYSHMDTDKLNDTAGTQNVGLMYYHEYLNDVQKRNFVRIYDGVMNFKKSIVLSESMKKKDFDEVLYVLQYGCPEIFQLGKSHRYDYVGNTVFTYYPQYRIDKRTYLNQLKQIEDKVEPFLKKVKRLSEFEKEKQVHDYILAGTTYNLKQENDSNMYGCLVQGVASCSGYSNAYTYLLRRLGIVATQVTGDAKDELDETARMESQVSDNIGHAWNLVRIDGDYYYCDLTWDDLANDKSGVDYHYSFLNVPYDQIMYSRLLVADTPFNGRLPKTEATRYSYYRMTGNYANNMTDINQILDNGLSQDLITTGSVITLQCADAALYQQVKGDLGDILVKALKEKKLTAKGFHSTTINSCNTLLIRFRS